MPKLPEALVIRNQITKSGTSVAANYREANRVHSRADFMNKIEICESEASETQYCLELIAENDWLSKEKLSNAHSECSELPAILTSIGKKKEKLIISGI